MIVLIVLAVLWTPCMFAMVLRSRHVLTPGSVYPQGAHAEPPIGGSDQTSTDGPAWTALDDHQLTRLLIDSAGRSATE